MVELNLCPGCNAFVNHSWTSCQACGCQLVPASDTSHDEAPVQEAVTEEPPPFAGPSIEFVAPTAEEPAPVAAITGSESEGFMVSWSIGPAPTATVHEPLTPAPQLPPEPELPTEPELPEPSMTEPVASAAASPRKWSFTISEPEVTTPEATTPEATTPEATTPTFVASSPEAYLEDTTSVAEEPEITPGIQAAMTAFTLNSSQQDKTHDGRLTSSLSPTFIKAMAGIGAVVALLAVIVVFAGNGNGEGKGTDVETPAAADLQTATPTDTWIDYADPDGAFTVRLPSTPAVSSQGSASGPVKVRTSVTPDGASTVSVVSIDLGAGSNWEDNQQVLKATLNALSASSGMEIKGQVFTQVNGRQQLDAHLTSKEASIDVRYFVKGHVLYSLGVQTNQVDGDPDVFDKLTNSFTLN